MVSGQFKLAHCSSFLFRRMSHVEEWLRATVVPEWKKKKQNEMRRHRKMQCGGADRRAWEASLDVEKYNYVDDLVPWNSNFGGGVFCGYFEGTH